MKSLIEAFPQNIHDAIAIAQSSTIRTPKNEVHNIIICGLGGSGIGAKIVANWIQDEIKIMNPNLSLHLVSAMIGIMVFFTIAVAPTVFKVLPQEWASRYVRSFFPKYYAFLGAFSILASFASANI